MINHVVAPLGWRCVTLCFLTREDLEALTAEGKPWAIVSPLAAEQLELDCPGCFYHLDIADMEKHVPDNVITIEFSEAMLAELRSHVAHWDTDSLSGDSRGRPRWMIQHFAGQPNCWDVRELKAWLEQQSPGPLVWYRYHLCIVLQWYHFTGGAWSDMLYDQFLGKVLGRETDRALLGPLLARLFADRGDDA